MTYATGSGTLSAMISALNTFTIANTSMTAPVSPGAKNWWRVVVTSAYITNRTGRTKKVDFCDALGVSLGAPTSTITNSEIAGQPASNVWAGASYWQTAGATRPFVGGFWTTPIEVEQVKITSLDVLLGVLSFTLEWSDDGSTWNALSNFSLGDDVGNLAELTFTVGQVEGLNVVSNGVLFTLATATANTGDSNWADQRVLPGGGTTTIYPNLIYPAFGLSSFTPARPVGNTLQNRIPPSGDVSAWHFFSDSTVSDHVNVAFSMTYEGISYWHHISFGLIDNAGLTHHGVAYMAIEGIIFFVNDTSVSGEYLARSLTNGNPFISIDDFGEDGTRSNSQWLFVNSGGSGYAVPDDGAWPARDTLHSVGSFGFITQANANTREERNQVQVSQIASGVGATWDHCATLAEPNPVSGFTSLGLIPVITRTSSATQGELCCYLGQMPNMRSVRIDSLGAGDEVTVGADTWKVFPRKIKTTLAEMDDQYGVSSGPAGWAYKKVL